VGVGKKARGRIWNSLLKIKKALNHRKEVSRWLRALKNNGN
jgi:hypothetical protein